MKDDGRGVDGLMFEAFVRPMSNYELDFREYSAESVLQWVAGQPPTPEDIQSRYNESGTPIFVVPAFAMPELALAKEARTNYVLGNYMSAIALAALCAEKYAELLGRVAARPVQREVLRNGFVESQSKFLHRLKKLKVIYESERSMFQAIADERNDYLHHKKAADSVTAGPDALRVLRRLFGLLQRLFAHRFTEGKTRLTSELASYMVREGMFSQPDSVDPEGSPPPTPGLDAPPQRKTTSPPTAPEDA